MTPDYPHPDDQLPLEIQREEEAAPDESMPDPLAAVQAEHDTAMGSLLGAEAGDDIGDALKAEHDAVLVELADMAGMADDDSPTGDVLAVSKSVLDKPIAPPQRMSRAERVAEHQKFLAQKGQDIEAFQRGDFAAPFTEASQGEENRGSHPTDTAVRQTMDAGVRSMNRMADMLIDLNRRLEALEELVSGDRL